MSSKDKKTLPLHKHLSYQVIEAEPGVFQPQPRGAHAKDVLVNAVVSLDETIAEWTRRWEAEDYVEKTGDWVEWPDATASKGKTMKCWYGSPNDSRIYLVKGGGKVVAGEMNFLVRAKVGDNSPNLDIMGIHVYDATAEVFLASRVIKANEFPAILKYHHFALKVEIPADKDNLWIFVAFYSGAYVDLYCDYAGLIPANIPISFADVTVLTEDPGSTGDLVDPGTTSSPTSGITIKANWDKWGGPKTASGGWDNVDSVTVPNEDVEMFVVHVQIDNTHSSYIATLWVRVYDQTSSKYYPRQTDGVRGCSGGYRNISTFVITIPENVKNHVLIVQAKTTSGLTYRYEISGWGHSQHTHPIIGDSHTTPISGDAHPHSDTEGGHEH